MNKIFEYIRLIFIVAGVLIGIQGPGFVDQYGKALQAHYFESQNSLKEFQDDADRFFEGSLQKLVEHYRKTPDPVILEGGMSISKLLERNVALAKAYTAFQENAYSPYVQIILYPIEDIRKEVVESYTYTVVLNQTAILIGLLSGLLVALSLELIILIIKLAARSTTEKIAPASNTS